jgi:signal recognition particle receptor subunit beta
MFCVPCLSLCFAQTHTVLVIGLNNAGKSTLLLNMNPKILSKQPAETINQLSTSPTQGLSLVQFRTEKNRVGWRVWDMSGHGRFRPLWNYYVSHVGGIVYVVDVTDGDRIACSRDEFNLLMDQPRVKERRLPILLLANKVDLGGSEDEGIVSNDKTGAGASGSGKTLTLDNIRVAFGIDQLNGHQKAKVFSTSGLTGSGVSEGFSWLNDAIKSKREGTDLL